MIRATNAAAGLQSALDIVWKQYFDVMTELTMIVFATPPFMRFLLTISNLKAQGAKAAQQGVQQLSCLSRQLLFFIQLEKEDI